MTEMTEATKRFLTEYFALCWKHRRYVGSCGDPVQIFEPPRPRAIQAPSGTGQGYDNNFDDEASKFFDRLAEQTEADEEAGKNKDA